MTTVESPLDVKMLDENADFGLDGLTELIEMYLNQADETMTGLQTAIKNGASQEVDQLAHRLAGSSAVCGITAMMQPLRTLEKQGREGRLDGADQVLAEATERLELCRRLLNEYLAGKHA